MKKLVYTLLFLAVAGGSLKAQSVYPMVANVPSAAPQTTVRVYLSIERDAVIAGPYARYAQKYLGVSAPSSDRTEYNLVDARLDYTAPDHSAPSAPIVAPVVKEGFPSLSVDRLSGYGRSAEEMASDAAQAIFKLRQQRLDILSGDASELFPSGMDAALAEIARLEQEYTALFLGKRTRSVEVRQFDITPVAGKENYELCKLPDPIVLRVVAEGGARVVEPDKSDKRTLSYYRIADFATATLSIGMQELASLKLPVYQFGVTILAP